MAKQKYNKRNRETELRVSEVPRNIRAALRAIAKNSDINFTVFMKQEFRKIVNSYPEKMRLHPDINSEE